MIDFSLKLPDLGTTIFTIMGKMAVQYNAVNLSQGFPNFDTDPKLLALVEKALKAGHNQYAPMQGVYSLREKISEKKGEVYLLIHEIGKLIDKQVYLPLFFGNILFK